MAQKGTGRWEVEGTDSGQEGGGKTGGRSGNGIERRGRIFGAGVGKQEGVEEREGLGAKEGEEGEGEEIGRALGPKSGAEVCDRKADRRGRKGDEVKGCGTG